MKIKTSELTDVQLAYAIGQIDPDAWVYDNLRIGKLYGKVSTMLYDHPDGEALQYSPASNWAQGGPIIEREFIRIQPESPYWEAGTYTDAGDCFVGVGETPLIAAMRCYVASKLGDEIEIPQELVA